MKIKESLAITVVFEYLTDTQLIQMQALCRKMYHQILPQLVKFIGTGLHHNKLFSYGIDEDELWIFNTEDRLWDVPTNTQYLYPVNKFGRYFNHNMQLAVFPTKVYLIGGSLDENLNEISQEVRCWDLKDNSVHLK